MDRPNESKDAPSVSDFFEGRSIFMTGASGFIGTVLLEALLRCCPGIASVYILLRLKRGLKPEQRKEEIFKKKVFTVLKERSPETLEKVHAVAGDTSKPGFGINEKDLQCITEQVSIVYHCAANLNLTKPIRYMVEQNGTSTRTIIQLCRQMKKFRVLVYTSTSYSNYNRLDLPIKEEVYRLPFHSQKFLDALKEENDDKLLELASFCKPDWPNWYFFSKCLSENILQDMASDLSVAIIRPSLVGCTWKSPMPGYLEKDSGFSNSCFGVGEGFIKVLFLNPNMMGNFIPADVVANIQLMAAWSIGTRKVVTSPFVVNCTSKGYLHVDAVNAFKTVKEIRRDFVPPNFPGIHKDLIIVNNRFLYSIVEAYEHYLPGLIADIILITKGKKPRALVSYIFFHKFMLNLRETSASKKSPEYERSNMDCLNDLLNDEDRKIFDTDIQNLKLEQLLRPALQEVPLYDWRKIHEIMIQYDWLISFLQYMVLLCCCYFIYWTIIKVYAQFQ